MNNAFSKELEARLLKYVKIDTQSSESSESIPSTRKQFDLLNLLHQELNDIGATEVDLKEYGALFATVPGNSDKDVPTIGFVAHVDTAPAYCGANVHAVVHRNYDGKDIIFPDKPNLILSMEQHPYLSKKIGNDIVTASGSTLLGADDKAGVSIIMTVANRLLNCTKIEHGPIRLAFSCDEEIGQGITKEFAKHFAADFAYTLDGGEIGQLEAGFASTIDGQSAEPLIRASLSKTGPLRNVEKVDPKTATLWAGHLLDALQFMLSLTAFRTRLRLSY